MSAVYLFVHLTVICYEGLKAPRIYTFLPADCVRPSQWRSEDWAPKEVNETFYRLRVSLTHFLPYFLLNFFALIACFFWFWGRGRNLAITQGP